MDERRTFPRVELVIELYGRALPMGLPITLLNISITGMAIRMEVPLPLRTPQRFDLTLEDGATLHLSGEIVHCEQTGASYTIGVHFTSSIADVFDRITAGGSIPPGSNPAD